MIEKSETVLITGGLGQVGYYTYQLLKDKYNVVILDNKSNSKYEAPIGSIFIQGNIQDAEIYSDLPKIDYIIHLAAQLSINKSVSDPIFDAENNILGTLMLLEFSRRRNIKKFVHLSSAATYGEPKFIPITEEHPRNPISPYGLSKLVAERYVHLYSELYDLKSVVLIPFNIYSPLQHRDDPYSGVIFKFIQAIKTKRPYDIEGDGNQTRDFIHAKDVAEAIKKSLISKKADNCVLNIGTGIPLSINLLSETLLKISNSNIKPNHVSPREADIYESYCSIEKAKKYLDFEITITLEEGLRDMFQNLETK